MSGARTVKLTHPDRVMWPDAGLTKRDLYDYFGAVAPVMLPHVRDRPVSLQRFRGAVEDGGFFQKEIPKGAPDWIARVSVPKHGGSVCHPDLCRNHLAQRMHSLRRIAKKYGLLAKKARYFLSPACLVGARGALKGHLGRRVEPVGQY